MLRRMGLVLAVGVAILVPGAPARAGVTSCSGTGTMQSTPLFYPVLAPQSFGSYAFTLTGTCGGTAATISGGGVIVGWCVSWTSPHTVVDGHHEASVANGVFTPTGGTGTSASGFLAVVPRGSCAFGATSFDISGTLQLT